VRPAITLLQRMAAGLRPAYPTAARNAIVVAAPASPDAALPVRLAGRLARASGAEVHVVGVQRLLLETQEDLQGRLRECPGALGLADVQIRIMAEVADGLIRTVKGRSVELLVGGRRVTAIVDAVRLRRAGDRYQGRLVARDVDWDGLPIETMSVIARSVRIE